MLNDEELKERLSNLKAPHITKEYIDSRIDGIQYFNPDLTPTVTQCTILLDNGFSVRGEAACVNAENFDIEIGKTLSYEDAFKKLWPLFGFLLTESQYQNEEK